MQNEGEHQDAAASSSAGSGGPSPLARVRGLAGAVAAAAGVRVEFLDPRGASADFDEHGILVPLAPARQMLSESTIHAALNRPGAILHVDAESGAAVSMPFFVGDHLGGFVTATRFSLGKPGDDDQGRLRDGLAVEPPPEAFGEKSGHVQIDYNRFFALIELLRAVAFQATLLALESRDGDDPAVVAALPPWAAGDIPQTPVPSSRPEGLAALRAREALEALYNSARDATLMLDSDLRIIAANSRIATIFGTQPDALVGVAGDWLRKWLVKNSRDPRRVSEQIEALLADPRAVLDDEIELISPREMVLRFYSAPLAGKAGAVAGRMLTFRDVTNICKGHRARIGAEKTTALGQAAAGLAHEINNIMAGVMTYADFALEDGALDKMREALKMSVAAADKASQLVGEFLSVSGPTETLRQDVDLHLELERLLDSVEQTYRKNNVRIHRLLEAVPRVSVDPVQILKVFHQVLQNGRDAVGKDGTITVRTEADWDRGVVRVIISDSGPGILPEHIDRVFDPFFTTKGVVSGGDTTSRGLGLSVAKGIIEAHGGKIYAGNVLPHGASFVIELPVPGAPAEQPPSPSEY